MKYSPDLNSDADECLTPSNILPPDEISWQSYIIIISVRYCIGRKVGTLTTALEKRSCWLAAKQSFYVLL